MPLLLPQTSITNLDLPFTEFHCVDREAQLIQHEPADGYVFAVSVGLSWVKLL